jgi:hypothetical protein
MRRGFGPSLDTNAKLTRGQIISKESRGVRVCAFGRQSSPGATNNNGADTSRLLGEGKKITTKNKGGNLWRTGTRKEKVD